MRFFSIVLCACLLAGCASRPGPEVLAVVAETPPAAREVTVYVATTRARAVPGTNVYTSDRSPALNYAEFTISIPPGHKPTRIEWPRRGRPDPLKDFAVVRQTVLTEDQLRAALAAKGRAAGGRGEVGVFVHGYNNNFQESLFRLAQLTADGHLDGTSILFAWPSAGDITGYITDKDAAAYSRDDLAHLLTLLAQHPQVGPIGVLAHSMGGWLTAESLRQLRLQGKDRVIGRLERVLLAAPDIDTDLFVRQIATIGRLDPPLVVLTSRDDRALRFASRVAGDRPRIGAVDVSDPKVQQTAAAYDVQIIDISEISTPDSLRHDRFVGLLAMLPHLEDRRDAGPMQAGAFVLNTIGETIAAPFRIGGAVLAGQ